MGHLEIPVRKWESVSVDIISLPETTSRSSDVMVGEILTVTDRATKMVVLIPCSSRWNAAEVADNSGGRWCGIMDWQGVLLVIWDRCLCRRTEVFQHSFQ